MKPWLTIIGMGEWPDTLSATGRAALGEARTVLGPERLLARLTSPPSFVASTPHPSSPATGEVLGSAESPIVPRTRPDTLPLAGRAGVGVGQKRIPWQSPLSSMLDQIAPFRHTPTAILATGDPMWFGIGATVARQLDPAEFDVHPAPSAFQLAAARLKWPLQHVAAISLHGRAVEAVHPHLLPGNRILALTGDRMTAQVVAEIIAARGYGKTVMTILENLGAADERITSGTAATFPLEAVGDFYVLALDCVADAGAALLPPLPGLPDEAFLSDGQLTQRG